MAACKYKHSQDGQQDDNTMQPVFVFILSAVFAVGGCQDGPRTFGTSLDVQTNVAGHDAHHHDHQAHVVHDMTNEHSHVHQHDHEHNLPSHEVPSPAVVVPAETVKVETVPILIGQIVNFPVVQTVPQPTAVGSTGDTSGVVSSLVHTQQQVVGNITAGFGSVVTSVVNPVVALLHNASVWLNRTAQNNVPFQHHGHAAVHNHVDTAVHGHDGSHSHVDTTVHGHDGSHSHVDTVVHGHDWTHNHGTIGVHGHAASHGHVSHEVETVHNGQISPVGSIPIFIIHGNQGDQVPTATVGSVVPANLSPADGSLQTPALGSQLFPFGVPAPVAALGSFLASAAAPIIGSAAPATTLGAEDVSSVVPPPTLAGVGPGNVTTVPVAPSTVAASVPPSSLGGVAEAATIVPASVCGFRSSGCDCHEFPATFPFGERCHEDGCLCSSTCPGVRSEEYHGVISSRTLFHSRMQYVYTFLAAFLHAFITLCTRKQDRDETATRTTTSAFQETL
ncbi:secreted protein, putative [Ixodes scapularis]|uniref:Secreted protein, putative n=1 Tax=Ixodes scapularis TaxID=6945 RepID=B7PXY5_IXOSC|nr:secreted protein, putative [Ixodes scapularis]|eukprot:XP_002402114.1 secreted protein, putative [Ixodes scapularis]